jgi:hypothetical protein
VLTGWQDNTCAQMLVAGCRCPLAQLADHCSASYCPLRTSLSQLLELPSYQSWVLHLRSSWHWCSGQCASAGWRPRGVPPHHVQLCCFYCLPLYCCLLYLQYLMLPEDLAVLLTRASAWHLQFASILTTSENLWWPCLLPLTSAQLSNPAPTATGTGHFRGQRAVVIHHLCVRQTLHQEDLCLRHVGWHQVQGYQAYLLVLQTPSLLPLPLLPSQQAGLP